MANDKLVPFGKHKGKPLEALLEDRQYLDWLTQQPWFREKYVTIYNVIINNGVEPSETPEHNAMQIRFLDEVYLAKFRTFLQKELQASSSRFVLALPWFEHRGFDVFFEHVLFKDISCGVEIKPTVGDDYPAVYRQMQRAGAGVAASYHASAIKPVGMMILLIASYTGVGATEQQFRDFFKSQGVTAIFDDEVDAVQLPASR